MFYIIYYYIVIVDDNSGSMGGPRQRWTAEKSKALIQQCLNANVKYRYCMFGSGATIVVNCQPDQVAQKLLCHEGTEMKYLADAAILATTQLLCEMTTPGLKRIMYVLNTDGEAQDSVEAAASFNTRFQLLSLAYPNMTTARTFVMGIGPGHDQKVLAAMSVGVSSYYNYPDSELPSMVGAVQTIASEFVAKNKITFHPSGKIVEVSTVGGNLVLNGVEVSLSDHSITLPNGNTLPLVFHEINPTNRLFVPLKLQQLKKTILELIGQIKSFTTVTGDKSKMREMFTSRKAILEIEFKELVRLVEQPQTPGGSGGANSMSFTDTIRTMRLAGATTRDCAQFIKSVLNKNKVPKEDLLSDISAISAVFKLCQSCLDCLRLGSKLNTELERDCMEVLSAGGFVHWTSKKIEKVKARAVKQVNPDSVTNITDKLDNYFRTLDPTTTTTDATLVDSREAECFWTLSSALELVAEKDVPILVGNIVKGDRELGFGSVNSCYVIEKALVSGRINVCLYPVSFKVFMGILSNKQQISRGPDGKPMNTMIGFLPDLNSRHSIEIAKTLSPLLASQLVTTNFVSTVGVGDFKNAMLIGLLAITNCHKFSRISREKLEVGFNSFYFSTYGDRFLKNALDRAIGFLYDDTTSGDVPAFSLAIADQFLLLAHKRVCHKASCVLKHVKMDFENNVLGVELPADDAMGTVFWRNLFLRVARDEMSNLFTAFGAAAGAAGDLMRSAKQKEAAAFLQLLSDGLNTDEMIAPFEFDSNLRNFPPSELPFIPETVLTFEDYEFDNYEEEGGEDNADDSNKPPSVVLPIIKDEQPVVLLLLPQQPNVRKFVQCALQLVPSLPLKDNGETFVESNCLNTFQGMFLLQFLNQLKPKIQFMVSCYNHFQHQTRTNDKEVVPTNSLFTLLGFEDDHDNGWNYLYGQIILALMYKENSVFNSAQEDAGSALKLTGLTLLNTVSNGYWQKLDGEKRRLLIQAENQRLRYLKQRYSRLWLQHPANLGFPLRICSVEHLRLINTVVRPKFKFEIECTLNPLTDEITGMAKNSFMCPLSSCFLKNVRASGICDLIYGPEENRSNLFLPHLHTTAAKMFHRVTRMIEEGLMNPEFTRYETFECFFCGDFKDAEVSIPVRLFASLRISEELIITPNATVDRMVAVLLKDYPESVHPILQEFVPGELEWQRNPVNYINQYFRSVSSRKMLTKEEFLAQLGVDKMTEDEKKAARLAHDENLSNPLGTKNAKEVVEKKTKEENRELGMLKKITHKLKRERRKNR